MSIGEEPARLEGLLHKHIKAANLPLNDDQIADLAKAIMYAIRANNEALEQDISKAVQAELAATSWASP